MKEKILNFEDKSILRIQIENGEMKIIMQAKHLGGEVKYTSVAVKLNVEETDKTDSLAKWIGETLLSDSSRDI
jgi:hypothetical protein